MRILLLTSNSPFDEVTGALAAGAEIAMRRIGERLAARGHEVKFVTLHDGERTRTTLNGVDVHILSRKGVRAGVGGGEDLIVRLARRWRAKLGDRVDGWLSGATHRRLQNMAVRHDHRSWRFLERLREVVDGWPLDLIHCNSSLPDPLVSAMLGQELRVPVVVRVGGRYWYLRHQRLRDERSRRLYLEQLGYAFGHVDCFAFNSHTLKKQTAEMLAEVGVRGPSDEVIIDIGVDPPRDTAAVGDSLAALDSAPPGLLVACIGKFKIDSKRQDLLVEAARRLRDEAPITVAFAGDGPTMGKIRKLAERAGVADRTLFLGSLPHAAVFELMRRADVVAHPTEFEGSSKALAEAMLCGRPLLVSDVPAMREQVDDGVTGLIAANRTESFVERLRELHDDPDLRRRLGEAAAEHARQTLDPDACVVAYEQLFERLIAGRRGANASSEVGQPIAEPALGRASGVAPPSSRTG